MVFILFFFSGATALVYEVVWSKYLSLMFGSTIQAQTAVLAVFMSGLALGSWIFGRVASSLANPLRAYGWMELGIGVYGFLFVTAYLDADMLFVFLGSPLLGHTSLLFLLKFALSVCLLVIPTLLMGGTLPLIAEWLRRRGVEAGSWSTGFYAVNTLGAVVGAGLAGFALVQLLGLERTLWLTGAVNGAIGVAAIRLSNRKPWHTDSPAQASAKDPHSFAAGPGFPMAGFALVGLSGAMSMGLEVMASRTLALVFGASLQAFATVLMAFILGIGIGSIVVASPLLKSRSPYDTSCALFLAASAWLGAFLLGIERVATLYHQALSGLARNEVGYNFQLALTALISIVVLGVPASMLGAVLPTWIRHAARHVATLSHQVGRLLFWNTVGSVAGVLLAGFVLMPLLGLRGAFACTAIALSLAALAIAWRGQRPGWMTLGLGVVTMTLVAAALGGDDWRLVMSAGVYRMRHVDARTDIKAYRREHTRLLFYEDAADATVSVEKDGEHGPDDPSSQVLLRINGKIDASSHTDLSTQYLLAHLPMCARPGSRDVFMFGLGSGITARALLGHPIQHLSIAENCEPVLRAAKWFEPWNGGALNNSRTHVWGEDARTVLKLSPQLYDVIISEPSNPWTVGIGSVFSMEFYDLAASRLKDGGIFVQWFHVYEMNADLAAMVTRTFSLAFSHVEIWDTFAGDVVLMGSNKKWASNPSVYRTVFERELPRKDLEQIGIPTPELLWARQLASQRTAGAIPGGGVIQSDGFPVLEYDAPRAFYIGENSDFFSRFDERTWQSDLASANKRKTLAALDDLAVFRMFQKNSSLNPSLMKGLVQTSRSQDSDWLAGFGQMPFALRPANRVPPKLNFPPGMNDRLMHLLRACATIQGKPAATREASQEIARILETIKVVPLPDRTPWTPEFFAGQAARGCIRAGDFKQAGELVMLGMYFSPDSPDLHYLSRIVNRAIQMPPPEDS